jgi:hypothetical protein
LAEAGGTTTVSHIPTTAEPSNSRELRRT